ncbi:hypothetical protein JCM18916_1062 [Cutibacterium acnes JCM 18916]|nr:hypothetical protein JCM18916_1062 [Cutibacterium acnes JCM 18916]
MVTQGQWSSSQDNVVPFLADKGQHRRGSSAARSSSHLKIRVVTAKTGDEGT